MNPTKTSSHYFSTAYCSNTSLLEGQTHASLSSTISTYYTGTASIWSSRASTNPSSISMNTLILFNCLNLYFYDRNWSNQSNIQLLWRLESGDTQDNWEDNELLFHESFIQFYRDQLTCTNTVSIYPQPLYKFCSCIVIESDYSIWCKCVWMLESEHHLAADWWKPLNSNVLDLQDGTNTEGPSFFENKIKM